jgi:hypothetical protein
LEVKKMGFAYTAEKFVAGNKRIAFGTFTNTGTTGSSGGDVVTGLEVVDIFVPFYSGTSAPGTLQISVDETFPKTGGAITIATDAGSKGTWFAIGR